MKVSIDWLKELVDLQVPIEEVTRLLPLLTIGLKEVTPEYFELDMKGYNRADLLSLRGVAYEISAITDSPLSFQENSGYTWKNKNISEVEAQVENSKLAPVYCLAKIEGLKVEKSNPQWIKKLNESGMRSVNNIADITNLVMLEYGQPLHSFDADIVEDGTIIVRTAKSGEEIVTLDNKKRKLETSDLLITDPEKALGLAGVMGGKNSEVADSTTAIILEAAIFDPVNLRQTASRLNLQSEASRRFQHGLTKKRLLAALDAAIRMYQDLGGKLTAITLIGNLEDPTEEITLNKEKLNSLVGIEFKTEEVAAYLKSLRFDLKPKKQGWIVVPPYFRLDVNIEADVIEEVARMYGYEKIPSKPLQGEFPEPIDQKLFNFIYNLKTTLVSLGLTEVQTYSFYSTKVLDNLNKSKEKLIRVVNPISSETEYLRDELWPNLLEKTAENLKFFDNVEIFEVGKTYRPKARELPEEEYKLAITVSDNTKEPIEKLYSLFKETMEKLGINIKLKKETQNTQEKQLFHPTRFAKLLKNKGEIGFIAEVHPRIVNKFGTEKRITVLEISL